MNLERSAWPEPDLADALAALTGRDITPPAKDPLELATSYGLEPVPVDWVGPPTAALVRAVAPGWCRTPAGTWLLIGQHRFGWVRLLGPDGHRWQRAGAIAGLLMSPPGLRAHQLVQAPELRRARAAHALAPATLVTEGSYVRLHPGLDSPTLRHVRAEGLAGQVAIAGLLMIISYLAVAAHWAIAGRHLLERDTAPAWLWSWLAIAAVAVITRVLGQRALGAVAVGLGAWWKRRVIRRATQLDPDAVHRAGPGWVLSRTFEVDAAEASAVGGAAVAVVGAVQVVVAASLLLVTPAGPPVLVALLVFLAAAALTAWLITDRKHRWALARRSVSTRLTEQLIEHRSRLVQGLPSGDDHSAQTERTAAYQAARRLDAPAAGWLGTMPTSWLALALTTLAVWWWSGTPSVGGVAATLGAVLLVASGLDALAVAWDDTSDAAVAVSQARDLLGKPSSSNTPPPTTLPHREGQPIISANAVQASYPERDHHCLDGFALTVRPGERVLLHGPSGAGKSTAVAVLAGHLQPRAGTVARRGLVVAVPQMHRNHLFSATLAFNLLLGCSWPPTPQDLGAAEDTCRDLGLGKLLDTMPAGLNQLVGETGWQLSDGEKARVFAARALLQKADLTILDESLGALDPVTATRCRDSIASRANAILLTHHP